VVVIVVSLVSMVMVMVVSYYLHSGGHSGLRCLHSNSPGCLAECQSFLVLFTAHSHELILIFKDIRKCTVEISLLDATGSSIILNWENNQFDVQPVDHLFISLRLCFNVPLHNWYYLKKLYSVN
jgi:hypothetical protein